MKQENVIGEIGDELGELRQIQTLKNFFFLSLVYFVLTEKKKSFK